MKKREIINKKLALYYKGFFLGGLVTMLGIILSQSAYPYSGLLQLIGVTLIFVSSIGSYFFVKCPACNKPLKATPTLNQLGYPKKLNKSYKHCPYCGVNFNEE
jgi:hypothetical protein